MANDKKEKTSVGEDILGGVIGQSINEFTIDIVRKIPVEVLEMIKAVGIDKVLPLIGTIAASVLPKKGPFGDRLSDFITELTSEIRRRIKDEAAGKTQPVKGASAGSGLGKIINTIHDPHLHQATAEKFFKNLAALFMQGKVMRPKNEQDQIIALLGEMEPRQLLVLLDADIKLTKKHLDVFVQEAVAKDKKTFDQSVKEFKKEMAKLGKLLKKELKPVDDFFGRQDRALVRHMRTRTQEIRHKGFLANILFRHLYGG